MKVDVFAWNGDLVTRQQSFDVNGTITLRVTKNMIQSVIQKSKERGWKIELEGFSLLSNINRVVYRMTITRPLIWLHEILTNLELDWVEGNRSIDYYRSGMEMKRYGKLTCVLVWSPNKGYRLQRRNFPVTYKSVYRGRKHFIAMPNTYSY